MRKPLLCRIGLHIDALAYGSDEWRRDKKPIPGSLPYLYRETLVRPWVCPKCGATGAWPVRGQHNRLYERVTHD